MCAASCLYSQAAFICILGDVYSKKIYHFHFAFSCLICGYLDEQSHLHILLITSEQCELIVVSSVADEYFGAEMRDREHYLRTPHLAIICLSLFVLIQSETPCRMKRN